MKEKNFNKKLSINKKTVADLNNVQLGRVMGYGRITIFETCSCVSCPASCLGTCDTSCQNPNCT